MSEIQSELDVCLAGRCGKNYGVRCLYYVIIGSCNLNNCRPISLTSVVCKQLELDIAGYIRQVWNKNDWLYEGLHGFRPGYSRESQVIAVCQEIAESLDKGIDIDLIIIDFSKAFELVPRDRLLTQLAAT